MRPRVPRCIYTHAARSVIENDVYERRYLDLRTWRQGDAELKWDEKCGEVCMCVYMCVFLYVCPRTLHEAPFAKHTHTHPFRPPHPPQDPIDKSQVAVWTADLEIARLTDIANFTPPPHEPHRVALASLEDAADRLCKSVGGKDTVFVDLTQSEWAGMYVCVCVCVFDCITPCMCDELSYPYSFLPAQQLRHAWPKFLTYIFSCVCVCVCVCVLCVCVR
jgi:hypothetical protein